MFFIPCEVVFVRSIPLPSSSSSHRRPLWVFFGFASRGGVVRITDGIVVRFDLQNPTSMSAGQLLQQISWITPKVGHLTRIPQIMLGNLTFVQETCWFVYFNCIVIQISWRNWKDALIFVWFAPSIDVTFMFCWHRLPTMCCTFLAPLFSNHKSKQSVLSPSRNCAFWLFLA